MNTNRANLSCKNGPKRENRDKGQKLAPNGKEPFNKVEEGLKKWHFTVYIKSRKWIKVRLNQHARKRPKRGIKRQVVQSDIKQRRALQQSWRGAQKKTFHSLWPSPKQLTNKPKISCKNRPKREFKHKGWGEDLKQKKTLDQTWRWAQNMTIYSSCRSPKMQATKAKKACKIEPKEREKWLTLVA